MHEIAIHESADEELKAASLFYEVRETDLGQEFLRELALSFLGSVNTPLLAA
jgi:hypothetical protein